MLGASCVSRFLRLSRDACFSPPPLLFADIGHCSQAMLFVDVNLFFFPLFRFQGKPTENDKLQSKKAPCKRKRAEPSAEDKRCVICGLP